MQKHIHTKQTGFTIVELLIVIVVIGILAAITIASFSGVQKQAIVTTLQSDLKGAATELEVDRLAAKPNAYAGSSTDLETSGGNTFEYSYTVVDDSYCLTATNNRKGVPAYMVTSDDTKPREGVCPGHADPNVPTTAESCFTFSAGTITNYSSSTNCSRDVIIPSTIGGVMVTNIGDSTFYNDQLTSVRIPSSVTNISISAFAFNKLTTVTIPNSVTSIGPNAFSYNQLTSATIPNSVTSIGSSALSHNQLTSVIVPISMTSIGIGVFSDNQLTSVTIPNSITSIGGGAFARNDLTSVAVPTGTTVAAGAFDSSVTVTRY